MKTSTDVCPLAWSYVETAYAREGVAEACLELQDRAGVDVIVLLHALRLYDVYGLAMDLRSFNEANALVAEWRNEVIIPLREMRRRLKPGLSNVPAELLGAIRTAIKAAEHDAEFTELCMLVESTSLGSLKPSKLVNLGTLIATALRSYSGEDVPHVMQENAVQRSVSTLERAFRRSIAKDDQVHR
jgi:uncharacterized protein (TIGR02444 family)